MLARQEMKCALKEIVNNVESIELAVPPDQLDLSTSMVILRGLKSLPCGCADGPPETVRTLVFYRETCILRLPARGALDRR